MAKIGALVLDLGPVLQSKCTQFFIQWWPGSASAFLYLKFSGRVQFWPLGLKHSALWMDSCSGYKSRLTEPTYPRHPLPVSCVLFIL